MKLFSALFRRPETRIANDRINLALATPTERRAANNSLNPVHLGLRSTQTLHRPTLTERFGKLGK